MRLLAVLSFVVLCQCTSTVVAEFPTTSLSQLQQLNHKPELYLVGTSGDFLITADTRVELYLRTGEFVSAYASQVLTNGGQVILRGTGQSISAADVVRVRYISTY